MGGAQSAPCEARDRALQIPVILRHILSYCRVKDLLECRLVCRDWEQESRINCSNVIKMKFRSLSKLRNFTDFVKKTNCDKYYTNFYLRAKASEPRTYIINPVLLISPENIKVLEIHGYSFINQQTFRRFLFGSMPNMQILTLRGIYIRDDSPKSRNTNCSSHFLERWNLKCLNIIEGEGLDWMELLSHFPGIQALKVDGITGWEQFFKSFNEIRSRDPYKLRLNRLCVLDCYHEYNLTMDAELFKLLTSRTLSLESLSLEMNVNDYETILGNILTSNMVSLRKLELERNAQEQLFLDTDQVVDGIATNFENLTEIVLRSRVFTCLSFLKFTPNLVKFKILQRNSNSDDDHQNFVAQTGHLNVKMMKCRQLEYTELLPGEDLNSLIDWFPNVEILKICLDDTTFPIVLERWPNLVNLHATESVLSEYTLTGLDKDFMNDINKIVETKHYRIIYPVIPPTVPWKNISWLRHLCTFVLTAPPDKWCDGSLGIVCAGFLRQQMKELKHVHVEGYNVSALPFCFQLEMAAWGSLLEDFKLLSDPL